MSVLNRDRSVIWFTRDESRLFHPEMSDSVYTDDICSLVPARIWSMYVFLCMAVWLSEGVGSISLLPLGAYGGWRGGILGLRIPYHGQPISQPRSFCSSWFPPPTCKAHRWGEVSQLSVQQVRLDVVDFCWSECRSEVVSSHPCYWCVIIGMDIFCF